MAKKDIRYKGIYTRKTKSGISYGIDYIHPITGQRVKKILNGVKISLDASKEELNEAYQLALKLRNIELTDATRGAINKAYGIKSKVKTVSFEGMVDAYLKWSKENKKSWETDKYRARALKRVFKGKLMSDINTFMIEKYKMLRAKKVAKNTVNKELNLGSQIFAKATEWRKYNSENPFLKASHFKIKKGKKPGSLSPDDVQAIMDEIKHPVKRDMVEFDFNTGWRISEIRKLKWKDVDPQTGTAWIVDSKNSESVEIELNDEAIDIISRQKRRSEYVFCHLNSRPFRTNIYAVIKNAAKKAGVSLPPRKAWHILRRTWASMLLQSGCDVETLRELGNWKDYSMPMWYADAGNSEHKKKVLNRIPKLGKKEENGTENGPEMELAEKVVSISARNH